MFTVIIAIITSVLTVTSHSASLDFVSPSVQRGMAVENILCHMSLQRFPLSHPSKASCSEPSILMPFWEAV